MEKRRHENAYSAIGFSYKSSNSSHEPENVPPARDVPLNYNDLRCLEHPSTATVDHGSEKDQFVPCAGQAIPCGMQLVSVVWALLWRGVAAMHDRKDIKG